MPGDGELNQNGKVYAFGALTGTLKWHYKTGNVVSSSPAIANGVVYIGSTDMTFYALHV